MRITLISPIYWFFGVEAIGLRILTSCLKREGHEVCLLIGEDRHQGDYDNEQLDSITELARGSDLIGISVMTNYFNNAVQITRKLKMELTVPVLWGGIHPTIRPLECLKHAEMVCIGEGEETLVELVKKMEHGLSYDDIPGIMVKGREDMFKPRPLIQDLNSLPFPDNSYEDYYMLVGQEICKMNDAMLKKYFISIHYRTLTSRGCLFSCTYCCNSTLHRMFTHQKKLRKRSVDNIIEELIQIKSKLPFLKVIEFSDDAFMHFSTKEIEEFSREYKEKIGIPLFVVGVSPKSVTKEKISLLLDAGMTRLRMGIQTGSERTKRLYKRNYSNQLVEESTAIINEFTDRLDSVIYDIILDNPWETDEDLIDTLMFLVRLRPPYSLMFFSLTFYPETDLYKKAKRDGIIKDDLNDVYAKNYLSYSKTYLNRLFALQARFAHQGDTMSPRTIMLLTHWITRRTGLGYLLYAILMGKSIIKRGKHLLIEGLKDTRRKDTTRIIRFLRTTYYLKRKRL